MLDRDERSSLFLPEWRIKKFFYFVFRLSFGPKLIQEMTNPNLNLQIEQEIN